jgi:hypothetical protein
MERSAVRYRSVACVLTGTLAARNKGKGYNSDTATQRSRSWEGNKYAIPNDTPKPPLISDVARGREL